jgi:hypothetical protein
LNHFAIAVVTATISDSAPIPKISRPAAITQSWGESAVMTAPRKQSRPKSIVPFRVPIRSISRPPSRTMKTFGML